MKLTAFTQLALALSLARWAFGVYVSPEALSLCAQAPPTAAEVVAQWTSARHLPRLRYFDLLGGFHRCELHDADWYFSASDGALSLAVKCSRSGAVEESLGIGSGGRFSLGALKHALKHEFEDVNKTHAPSTPTPAPACCFEGTFGYFTFTGELSQSSRLRGGVERDAAFWQPCPADSASGSAPRSASETDFGSGSDVGTTALKKRALSPEHGHERAHAEALQKRWPPHDGYWNKTRPPPGNMTGNYSCDPHY